MASRTSYFWNSRDRDRVYDAASFEDWLMPFFTTGVFNGCFSVSANDNMSVTLVGGPLEVNNQRCGFVNIGGKVMKQVGEEVFDVPTASGNLSRIDRVVLRCDRISRDLYPLYVVGNFSNNPAPPPLVREHGIYDLSVCQVHVDPGVIKITQDKIQDERMDPDVCGWVAATVDEIDFSQITAQFDAFFSMYSEMISEQYQIYLALIDGKVDDAQDAYNAFVDRMNSYEVTAQAEFEAWVASLKDILDEEVAGHLQLEIEELQAHVPVANIGTVDCSHVTDQKFPVCIIGAAEWAFGFGGAGLGPFGGTNLSTVQAGYEYDGAGSISVTVPQAFAAFTNSAPVGENQFSFYPDDTTINTTTLLLQVQN
ncbi:hypothetical protein LJC49_01160 [Ruminococcaceae bacterium OttesenSCG-928-I18]|nr:hypothetical protein [Ruminococcaceae bacterium OttesenSCG-928-I18]